MSDQARQLGEVHPVKGIAEYLGISESKVRQLIRRNAIPYFKIDGSYRFYLPVIQDWLREITIKPTKESEAEYAQTTANRIWKSIGGNQ